MKTAMDKPERAVRVWNEINSDPQFKAEQRTVTYLGNSVTGWIAPFIENKEGKQASPEEICQALCDIYQRTGRVVVDALTRGNFKRTNDGKIVCVDIGAALKLESQQEDEKSQASLDFWEEMKSSYKKYFKGAYDRYRQYLPIVQMTKALLVLQHFRPDVRDVSQLKSNADLVKQLSSIYDLPDQASARQKFFVSTVSERFSIREDYFTQLSIFKDLFQDACFTQEDKTKLCQLYLKGKFTQGHKVLFGEDVSVIKTIEEIEKGVDLRMLTSIQDEQGLLRLCREEKLSGWYGKLFCFLIRECGLSSEEAIEELEKTDDTKKRLDAEMRKLINAAFSKVSVATVVYQKFSELDDWFPLVAVIRMLRGAKILTKGNLEWLRALKVPVLKDLEKIVSMLETREILTQENFDLIAKHKQLKDLAKRIDELAAISLTTNEFLRTVINTEILPSNIPLCIQLLSHSGFPGRSLPRFPEIMYIKDLDGLKYFVMRKLKSYIVSRRQSSPSFFGVNDPVTNRKIK